MAVGGGIAFGTAGLATAVAHTAAAAQATTATQAGTAVRVPLLRPPYPPCPRVDADVDACLHNNNVSDNENGAKADAVAVGVGEDEDEDEQDATESASAHQSSGDVDLGDFSQLDVLSNTPAPQPISGLVPGSAAECDEICDTPGALAADDGESGLVPGSTTTEELADTDAGLIQALDDDDDDDGDDDGDDSDDESDDDESDDDDDLVTPTPTPSDFDKNFTVDLGPWDDGPWGGPHGHDGGCFEVECWKKEAAELPMTGTDVRPLMAAGTGLLLIGAAGTVVAVRRRRSSDAK
ncbi:LPXTG cell wall anchor domain-containing protein [Nonomuraea sp. 3-1Str]|uniref:LPXTG cell wall anchor domain-containing protein n=1 Tax=Nonomuraea sp. 3-1Str TaxID=2929801 RepID=UPI002855EE9A|nr:LPXTG cell wall anchor domain-containing protein [Nonomuraea sp. 3-1Str]MDR8414601.1 LPXTG cell wall anchor domain-containing protein [Nonomuraea sp. 3-1Str]